MPPIIVGSFELILLSILSLAFGHRIAKVLGLPTAHEPLGFTLRACIGLAGLQIIPFALFALGLGTPLLFRIVTAAFFLLLIPDAKEVLAKLLVLIKQVRLDATEKVLAVAALILFCELMVRAVTPSFDGDALSYQLTVGYRFLHEHRFVYLPTITYSNWPVAGQIMFAMLTGIYRNSTPAIVQMLFGSITFAAAMELVAKCNGRRAAALTMALLFSYGTLVQQMAVPLIDVGLTETSVVAIVALYFAVTTHDRRNAYLFVSALAAGFSATMKLTGIWTIVALAGALLLAPSAVPIRQRLREASILCLTSLAVVMPWFFKTWVLTGNPLYPIGWSIFGGIEWSRQGTKNFGFGHLIWNTPRGMLPTPGVLFWSHMLNIFAGLVVFSVVWLTLRKHRLGVPAVWCSLFILAICAANYLHPRFLMPAVPIIAALFVSMLPSPKSKSAGWAIAILGSITAFASAIVPQTATFAECVRVSIGMESRTELLKEHMPDFDVTRYANLHVPDTARILIGTYANNLAYYKAEALWPEWWEQDSFHYDSPERLLADLNRLHVEYIVYSADFPDWCAKSHSCRMRMEREPVIIGQLLAKHGTLLYESNKHGLYIVDH